MIFDHPRNVAVVVAHSDDESMWAGGILARYGEIATVICCSIPRADPIRAWKFFDACAVFGATAKLLPFVEPRADESFTHLNILDLDPFDLIVTHNEVGEYGHLQHLSVNSFVRSRWRRKTATFGYRPNGQGTQVLRLTRSEQERRMKALQCYDHVSPHDNKPKWQALLDRYPIDLRAETYNPPA